MGFNIIVLILVKANTHDLYTYICIVYTFAGLEKKNNFVGCGAIALVS